MGMEKCSLNRIKVVPTKVTAFNPDGRWGKFSFVGLKSEK